MTKKIIALTMTLLLVFSLSVTAFAHPPIDKIQKPYMPENAAKGLHNAASNLDPSGVAYHVFFYLLSPHATE